MNDLRWWNTQLQIYCSSPILKLEASVVITSDASLHDWGVVCLEVTTGGLWTIGEAGSHTNLLELKVDYLVLQCFLKESVSTGFNKAGQVDSHRILESYRETGLFPLCKLALNIWTWCLACITLYVEYFPGIENTIADWESRHHHAGSN